MYPSWFSAFNKFAKDIIPILTAEDERGFSAMNMVSTDLRNSENFVILCKYLNFHYK